MRFLKQLVPWFYTKTGQPHKKAKRKILIFCLIACPQKLLYFPTKATMQLLENCEALSPSKKWWIGASRNFGIFLMMDAYKA